MMVTGDFTEIWLVDFEFSAPGGERPDVVCLVARELYSGQTFQLWRDEIDLLKAPPYSIGSEALFVAYYASAEIGCHLSLGWDLPENVLDLFVEFRNATNGLELPCGRGLLGALAWHGLDSIDTVEKESMRQLVLRGGPWSESEKTAVMNYCKSDVDALGELLPRMLPALDIGLAVFRGSYMKAAACIEHNGIPIDTDFLEKLKEHWASIQDRLIAEIDTEYHVYDGTTFKQDKFAQYLAENDIAWPMLESGRLDLKDDTFKDMSRAHPELAPLRELRVALSQMRLSELAIGTDGRNRCMLSAFRARTGRNQPSNSKFIFGPSVWLRGLIKPPAGRGVAYVDWSQQEFGIAAALSGDLLMKEAYRSGDPYLAFAIQAGAAPANATKQSHKAEREQFKACVLAVQYGMGSKSLSDRIGQPEARAKELLRLHRETYRTFWAWSDAAVDYAMLYGSIWTTFGWTVHTGTNPNPRFLRNFLMQGNGAEMLRIACSKLVNAGITVCAPVHDAVLIEAPLEFLSEIISKTQQVMTEASELVLDGFRLRSDVEIIRYPDRYADSRGHSMWRTVEAILDEAEDSP